MKRLLSPLFFLVIMIATTNAQELTVRQNSHPRSGRDL